MDNLKKYFKKYKIDLDGIDLDEFEAFFNLVISENQKYNLTSITDEDEFIIKHFVDSLLPLEYFKDNAKIVDIGSGGGFPAIPLKLANKNLDFTMLDSVNKKVNFLNLAIEKLGLKNIKAQHCRVEDFAKTNREKFDICSSRAVASLPTLLEYALPLLKVGGCCIFYKAQKIDDEISLAQNALNKLGGKIKMIAHYELEENERNVLIVQKISKTPITYPRGQNKPKSNPL